MTGSVRVDAWLWAVRVYKTRSAATTACRAGHVRVGGERAKAAQPLRVGDELRVRIAGWNAGIRRRIHAVPWQLWRTLLGLVVLAALWIGIARACEQRRANRPPEPVPGRPLMDSCRPAPEPYLD